MELRALESNDLFTMIDIINKIGVDQVKKCFEKPEVMKLLKEDNGTGELSNVIGYTIGFEIMSFVMSNITKAKDDIFSFVADLTGEDKEKIVKLPPAQFIKIIQDITRKEEFTDFLSQVSEFFK